MGEKLSDLEQFYPDRMASRILGMGDVLTLIEKLRRILDIEGKAKKRWQKMRRMNLTLKLFRKSMKSDEKDGRFVQSDGHDARDGLGGGKMPEIDTDEAEKNMRKNRGNYSFHDTAGT